MLGFTTREGEEHDGELTVDVTGYGESVELRYRRSPTGHLSFRHAFHHGGTSGDRLPRWRDVRVALRGIRNVGQLLGVADDDRDPLSEIENMRDWGDS